MGLQSLITLLLRLSLLQFVSLLLVSQFVRHFRQQWGHGCSVRDYHEPPAPTNSLADGSEIQETIEHLGKNGEDLLPVLDGWVLFVPLHVWYNELDKEGDQLEMVCCWSLVSTYHLSWQHV